MRIRQANLDDVAAIAAIDRAAREAALSGVAWAHPWADAPHWIANILMQQGEVIILEHAHAPVGYLALHDDWVAALYLHPSAWRRGFGSALLNQAKTLRPQGLQLWCFQINARARAFYEHHGFIVAEMTDGRDNEEREPDIRYKWGKPGT